MSKTVQDLLMRNLLEVFGERDPVKRRAVIEAIYAPATTFIDPEGSYSGWDGVEQAAATLQAATPGFAFSAFGDAQVLGAAVRLRWAYGPAEAPQRVTGTDFALVNEGRIVAMYTFVDAHYAARHAASGTA
ncbi:nuclear transport factor 2 family protein [Pseudolabrys taiwanensis]|nr:nuclear transport factor 2 family protein [Pseudolabrys taiwanensis]